MNPGRAWFLLTHRASVAGRWVAARYEWLSVAVGLAGIAMAAIGVSAIVEWVLPTAPAWAIRGVVLGGWVAVLFLGLGRLRGLASEGVAGILARGRGGVRRDRGTMPP